MTLVQGFTGRLDDQSMMQLHNVEASQYLLVAAHRVAFLAISCSFVTASGFVNSTFRLKPYAGNETHFYAFRRELVIVALQRQLPMFPQVQNGCQNDFCFRF